MIQNINLDIKYLQEELKKYKIIITFNGATFDIPFLKKNYPGLIPDIPLVDLKTMCNRVGLTGGLKEIEKQLNIKREDTIVQHMYGGDPLLLWRKFWATGDEYFLNLLVSYNNEDIINLKTIADSITKKLKDHHFKQTIETIIK